VQEHGGTCIVHMVLTNATRLQSGDPRAPINSDTRHGHKAVVRVSERSQGNGVMISCRSCACCFHAPYLLPTTHAHEPPNLAMLRCATCGWMLAPRHHQYAFIILLHLP
jgi:hypothetical protein